MPSETKVKVESTKKKNQPVIEIKLTQTVTIKIPVDSSKK